MRNLFKYSTTKVMVTFALVVLCIITFRYIQPQCEPCAPGEPCPPCISNFQIFIAAVGGVLAVYVIVLIGISSRKEK